VEAESAMKKMKKLFPDPYITPFNLYLEKIEQREKRNRSKRIDISSAELREALKNRDVNRKLRLLQALKPTAKKKGSRYHMIYRLVFGFSKPTQKQIISQSPYSSLKQSLKPVEPKENMREAWEKIQIYYYRDGKFRPAPIVEDAKTFAKFFGRTAEQALFDTVSWYLLPSFRREVKNLFKKYRHFLVGDGNGN
jgi:hypothetical protein